MLRPPQSLGLLGGEGSRHRAVGPASTGASKARTAAGPTAGRSTSRPRDPSIITSRTSAAVAPTRASRRARPDPTSARTHSAAAPRLARPRPISTSQVRQSPAGGLWFGLARGCILHVAALQPARATVPIPLVTARPARPVAGRPAELTEPGQFPTDLRPVGHSPAPPAMPAAPRARRRYSRRTAPSFTASRFSRPADSSDLMAIARSRPFARGSSARRAAFATRPSRRSAGTGQHSRRARSARRTSKSRASHRRSGPHRFAVPDRTPGRRPSRHRPKPPPLSTGCRRSLTPRAAGRRMYVLRTVRAHGGA